MFPDAAGELLERAVQRRADPRAVVPDEFVIVRGGRFRASFPNRFRTRYHETREWMAKRPEADVTEWLSIRYREFWDVPRIFLVTFQGQLYLFDCPFDEVAEDFAPHYHVFSMPAHDEDELAGSWNDLSGKAIKSVGDVVLGDVHFDATKRKAIDSEVLARLAAASKTNGAAATNRMVSGS
jgi:hypothetical protein